MAAGAALASSRPACISEMRSQRSASFMKWVEMKIVTLSRATAPRSGARSGRAPPGPRPRWARRGSAAQAGAPWPPPATRWRMPSGRASGCTSITGARSKRRASSAMQGRGRVHGRVRRAPRAGRGSGAPRARRRARRTATCSPRGGASRCCPRRACVRAAAPRRRWARAGR